MKILNRPMFRMGGPIKEGIMNGIQEPRQKYNQGNMVFPANANIMLPTGINVANSAKAFENIFQNNGIDARMGTYPGQKIPLETTTLEEKMKPYEKAKNVNFAVTDFFEKNMNTTDEKIPRNTRYGVVMVDNPDFGKIKRADKAIAAADAEGPVGIEGKNLTSSGIEDIKKEETGGLPEVDKVLTKKERTNNILEMLGYDKAKKNALYDAMINAGQRISRTGLGADNLVSDIIQDTSTVYDKPEKLREAANLMDVQQQLKLDQIDASKDKRAPIQKTIEYYMSEDGGNLSRKDATASAKNQPIEAFAIFQEAKSKGTTTEAVDYTASKMASDDKFGEGLRFINRIPTKLKGAEGLQKFIESDAYNGDGVYTRGGEILVIKNGKATNMITFKGTGETGIFGGEK